MRVVVWLSVGASASAQDRSSAVVRADVVSTAVCATRRQPLISMSRMAYLLARRGCKSHDEKRGLHGEKQADPKLCAGAKVEFE